jgi:lipoprotein signal peptidase
VVDDVTAGGAGEAIYVASTAAVLLAVLRNLRVAGMLLIAVGAICNLAAIVANGGVMPTTAAALQSAGLSPTDGFSNSAVLEDPALAPLTDIFALPSWVPFHNVFSVGDVLIAAGIVVVIAMGMRRGASSAA